MLNLLAAVVSYMYSSAWIFPVLIVFGGAVTYVRDAVILKAAVKEAPGDEGACVVWTVCRAGRDHLCQDKTCAGSFGSRVRARLELG